jgi:hypothetical protein
MSLQERRQEKYMDGCKVKGNVVAQRKVGKRKIHILIVWDKER